MNMFKNKKLVMVGFDQIELRERSLFIANHVSKSDIPFLHDALPKHITFAVHASEISLYGEVSKHRKFISYDFNLPKSLTNLTAVIENGEPLLLFPEAKISTSGSLGKIYKELAEIIVYTNPSIYPITIVGTEKENYFPFPFIKVALDKPTNLTVSSELTMEQKIRYVAREIESLFRSLRFKHANKENVNLFNELLETAKTSGDKSIILEDTTTSMTYKDLLLSIYVFQHKLKSLLPKERTIGVFLPTVVGNVLTLFSLFKLGKVPALLNFSMGPKTLLECVETSKVRTIITSRAFIKSGELEESLAHLEANCSIIYLEDVKESISANDKLKGLSEYALMKKADMGTNEIILFTSGSENKPKGVILTHENIFSNIQQALSMTSITNKDRMFNCMPMFHSFGLTVGSFLPLLTGMYVFLYPSPLHHKMIPELIYQKEATILFGTSTFFAMYGKNADPYDLHTLRLGIVGSEKLKEDVYNLWFHKFGIRIYEGYGVTEASPILSLNTPNAYRNGSVGKLLPGIEYRVEPIEGIKKGGNLFVKGPNIMKGYLIHSKGFVPLHQWHDTGDIVEIDEDGYVFIVSRLKRFAKLGGEMVSLNLVEDLAAQCFSTTSLATVSIADKRKGEKIILFSTVENNALREFKKFIKGNKHSSLLIPKEIHFIEQIPLLGTGKTDYVSLQKLAEDLEK